MEADLKTSDDEFEKALAGFEKLRAGEGPEINPDCRTRLLCHGRPVDRSLILFHGLANCPHQYHRLAPVFFDLGFNVLLPRMPRHGLADRLTDELGKLNPAELKAWIENSIDLGLGLGRRLFVVGLSAGGVAAAWAAQFRPEVERAVLISPAFGVGRLGAALNELIRELTRRLPNIFVWNDPIKKENWPGPDHQYLRQSSRALAAVTTVGREVRTAARQAGPAAGSIMVVTNDRDRVVDNTMTAGLVDLWKSRAEDKIETYEFDRELGLIHDLIGPDMKGRKTDLVYPVLVDLILGKNGGINDSG